MPSVRVLKECETVMTGAAAVPVLARSVVSGCQAEALVVSVGGASVLTQDVVFLQSTELLCHENRARFLGEIPGIAARTEVSNCLGAPLATPSPDHLLPWLLAPAEAVYGTPSPNIQGLAGSFLAVSENLGEEANATAIVDSDHLRPSALTRLVAAVLAAAGQTQVANPWRGPRLHLRSGIAHPEYARVSLGISSSRPTRLGVWDYHSLRQSVDAGVPAVTRVIPTYAISDDALSAMDAADSRIAEEMEAEAAAERAARLWSRD